MGYYDGSDVGRTVPLDYLVFQFGPWLVKAYDLQQPGDFEDRMSDDERATWAASLDGETDEHGFLVLKARPPLEVGRSGNAVLGQPGASTYLLLQEGGCGHEHSDTSTPRLVSDLVGIGAAWCDAGTGLHVYVAGPAEFVERVVDGLVIRVLTSGFEAVLR